MGEALALDAAWLFAAFLIISVLAAAGIAARRYLLQRGGGTVECGLRQRFAQPVASRQSWLPAARRRALAYLTAGESSVPGEVSASAAASSCLVRSTLISPASWAWAARIET